MSKDASRVVDKFRRNFAAAGPEYTAGVAAPKRDWLEQYKKSSDRMKAELQKALSEDRHLKGAARAGTAKWQERAKTIGASRFTGSASAAAEGYQKVVGEVLAAGDAATSKVQTMADTTIEQRIARSGAAQMAIHDHWRKTKGM